MIAKYHVPAGPIHPFVGAGYAPRVVHGTDVLSGYYLSGISVSPPASIYSYYFNQRYPTNYATTNGIVVSGGLDFRFGHVRISPELRYIRWSAPFLNEYGGDGSSRFVSNQNELFVLLGLSWP